MRKYFWWMLSLISLLALFLIPHSVHNDSPLGRGLASGSAGSK